MVRIFFIGTGSIAHRHAAAVQRIPGVEIVGVCDLNQTRAEEFIAKHKLSARVFTDVAAGLDALTPTAAVLLTPRYVRLPVVKQCVERGAPLLMEKPPCHSEEVGAEIKELLVRSNLVHSVGFPTRYEPSLDAALQQINGERLGMVQILMATPMAIQPILDRYPDGYLVERSGGLAGDQGIHYVDIARYIARSEVKTARALGTNRVLPVSAQVTTRDTAGWVLEMANGVVVTHAHTWCASNWTCQIRLITDRSDVTVNGFGDLLGQFEAEHRAFLAAVASGDMRTVRSTYPDALESFRVTEEINRQLYENPVAS